MTGLVKRKSTCHAGRACADDSNIECPFEVHLANSR